MLHSWQLHGSTQHRLFLFLSFLLSLSLSLSGRYIGFEDDEKFEEGKPAEELASPSEFESEGNEEVLLIRKSSMQVYTPTSTSSHQNCRS